MSDSEQFSSSPYEHHNSSSFEIDPSAFSGGFAPEAPLPPRTYATMNGGEYPGSSQQAPISSCSSEILSQTNHAPTYVDYSHFDQPARIAVYDDIKSAPRIIQIQGGPTHELIEQIASLTYKHAKEVGGKLPYTVIREVSENFIHAQFSEVVVSIMDNGNTIRFSDQGPGIKNKEIAKEPGFTSAIEPMKRYIRGVGSGFPLMEEYLSASHGYFDIEDNVDGGCVITISLLPKQDQSPQTQTKEQLASLTENDRLILQALTPHKQLGITELHNEVGLANSSIHTSLGKLETAGYVEKVGKKRRLTEQGLYLALLI